MNDVYRNAYTSVPASTVPTGTDAAEERTREIDDMAQQATAEAVQVQQTVAGKRRERPRVTAPRLRSIIARLERSNREYDVACSDLAKLIEGVDQETLERSTILRAVHEAYTELRGGSVATAHGQLANLSDELAAL